MKRLLAFALMGMVAATASAQEFRPVISYDESKIKPYTLPELMCTEAGEEVTTREQWERVRRPELLRLFSEELYGYMPQGKVKQRFELTAVDDAYAEGRATHKTVVMTFRRGDVERRATIHLYLPKSEHPVPLFMFFCGELKEPTEWLVQLLEAGYGLCTGDNNEFFADRQNDPAVYPNSVLALWGHTSEEELPMHISRALGCWAWGHSRAMDYLETDPDVDATRVAIMGHSRGAKLAAWAAVNDARFAAVILNNSGCAGAALFRRKFGEHAHRLNRSFPYWMCENFHKYNERDYAIPVDQHQLLALIAPRPLYVASGAEDLWADPKGEFLGLAHAEPIYNLYGYQGVATMEWPAIDTPIGHRAAYHVRTGGHGVLPYDWQQYIRFVDKWLKK